MISISHSLFDATALSRFISSEFEIGPVTGCQLWRSFVNDVYRLEAAGKCWWLRIHPFGWRALTQTQAEVEALHIIAAAGGSVALPVKRRCGGYLAEVEAPEGTRTAVLFEDAPGSDLGYFGPDRNANARRYGEAVAQLHDACEEIRNVPARKVIDLTYSVEQPVASLARHICSDDQPDLIRISKRLIETLGARGDLSLGFCHGDLNSSNIHFKQNMAVAIDFDCCGWGWRAFELAAFARGVTWASRPSESDGALIRAYFEGYVAHRPVSAPDLEVQPAMLLAQRMWVTALHLEGAYRWGTSNFGQSYASRFMNWLRNWESVLDGGRLWE